MYRTLFVIGFITLIACTQRHPETISKEKNDSSTSQEIEKTDIEKTSVKADGYDSVPAVAADEFADFIPPGFVMLDTCSGDLNLDEFTDMVLVLKKPAEDSMFKEGVDENRPVLLLLANSNKTWRLVARNDHAVLCYGCGGVMGDPFMGIVIKKGFFSLEYYGGSSSRWSRTITFKFNKSENAWFLHKDSREHFPATEPENVTTKIYSTRDFGSVGFEDFDINK